MTVIQFPAKKPLAVRQEDAWNEYVALLTRAHETFALSDGIAAAKAYGRFFDLFNQTETEGAS